MCGRRFWRCESVLPTDLAYYLAGVPPHPYSGSKFLILIDLGEVLRCKIYILLELAAEYRFQTSYGVPSA